MLASSSGSASSLKPAEWRLLDRMTGNQSRGGLEARSRTEDYGISNLEAYKAELEKLKN